jgi:hypothetical protein
MAAFPGSAARLRIARAATISPDAISVVASSIICAISLSFSKGPIPTASFGYGPKFIRYLEDTRLAAGRSSISARVAGSAIDVEFVLKLALESGTADVIANAGAARLAVNGKP